MHDVAPVKGGSNDVETVARLTKLGETQLLRTDQIDHQWANLWRNVVLSSLGKTMFPYCQYIRALDLNDLEYLLDDSKLGSRSVFVKTVFTSIMRVCLLTKWQRLFPRRACSIQHSDGDSNEIQEEQGREPTKVEYNSNTRCCWRRYDVPLR